MNTTRIAILFGVTVEKKNVEEFKKQYFDLITKYSDNEFFGMIEDVSDPEINTTPESLHAFLDILIEGD